MYENAKNRNHLDDRPLPLSVVKACEKSEKRDISISSIFHKYLLVFSTTVVL